MEKKLKSWLKKPKVKVSEVPKESDVIIQLFVERTKTEGGIIIEGNDRTKKPRDYKIQAYPYGYVISADEECKYQKGDVIYLSDNILITDINEAWISWAEKIENSHGVPHDPEPNKFIGGLNELEMFRFKKNKFKRDSDKEDEELYQIPIRIIKGYAE